MCSSDGVRACVYHPGWRARTQRLFGVLSGDVHLVNSSLVRDLVGGGFARALSGGRRLAYLSVALSLLVLLAGVGVPLVRVDRSSDKQWVPAGGSLADQIDFMAPFEEINRERENTFGYLIAKPREGGNALDDPAAHLDALHTLLKHVASTAAVTAALEWEDLNEDEQARRMEGAGEGEAPPAVADQFELSYSKACKSIDSPLFDGWFDGGAPCINQSPLDCFSEGVWEMESRDASGTLPPPTQLKLLVDYFNNVEPNGNAGNPWWHYPGYTDSFHSLEREEIIEKLGSGCENWFKLNRLPIDTLLAGYERDAEGALTHVAGLVAHLNQAPPRFNIARRGYPITPTKMKELNDEYLLELERIVEEADADMESYPHTTFTFFPSNAVDRMYDELVESRLTEIIIGYVIMIAYVILSQFTFDKATNLSVVGVLGTLCVVLANLSACGLMAIFGVVFNHTMMQALPFLAVGLGVDDMFLLLHTYAGVPDKAGKTREEIITETLREAGSSVTVTSACNATAFFAACVVPIPALRSFLVAAGVVVILNYVVSVTCLPVLLSFQADFQKRVLAERGVSKGAAEMTAAEAAAAAASSAAASQPVLTKMTVADVVRKYATFMQQLPARLTVLVAFLAIFISCAVSISTVEKGTEFKDLAADGTFLRRGVVDAYDQIYSQYIQEKWVVRDTLDYSTRGFDVVQLHNGLRQSKWAYDDNPLPTWSDYHWIDHMWLACPGNPTWDVPIDGVDQTVCNAGGDLMEKGKLFNKVFHHWRNPVNGPNALYAAEDGMEAFGYTTNVTDYALDNKLLMSTSLMPIDMRKVTSTQDKIDLVTDLREIMEASGIDAFPYGDNINQIEQFMSIDDTFWTAVGVAVPCVLLACVLVGMSLAASFTVAANSLFILVEVYGALGIFGFRFDATQAVCLLMCIGMAVEYTAHLITAYEYSIGTREEKVVEALLRTGVPILQGGMSSFLGLVVLAASPLPYVRSNFFFVYFILIVLGCLHGVVILPALLGLFGWTSAEDFPDLDAQKVPRKRRLSSLVVDPKAYAVRRASLV